MPPSTEPRDHHSCSIEQSVCTERVKRSVKFDQTVEFSDKAVGILAPQEEEDDRIRARDLRHRLRREWSDSQLDASQEAAASSPPAPPSRKRSMSYDAKAKDSMAPMVPQRQRSIGLTRKDDIPLPHRTS